MRYFGGKHRIRKDLWEYFNSLDDRTCFVDLFCGACNIIQGVDYKTRIANDNNPYLIAMFKEAQNGRHFPHDISEEQYKYIRYHKDEDMGLTGFVGVGCSFAGKWWGGYAIEGKRGYCNYANTFASSLEKDLRFMDDVIFTSNDYDGADIPLNSVVYCDIPYKSKTNGYYKNKFDHDKFYRWVECNHDKYRIYISEYDENNPGYKVVYRKESHQEIRGNNGRKPTTESILHPYFKGDT